MDANVFAGLAGGIGTLLGAYFLHRNAKDDRVVTGFAALTDRLQEEDKDHRVHVDWMEQRHANEVGTLKSQLSEARAEIASLKAEAAARCAGDLVVDGALPEEPPHD